MHRPVRAATLATLALLVTLAAPALGHAGGEGPATRFVMPAWVVWVLGALVVVVTFAIVGVFLSERRPRADGPQPGPPGRSPGPAGPLARVGQALGLVVALGLVAAPWLPPRFPVDTLLWAGIWSLLPILTYLALDPWPLVSPLRLVARALGTRAARGRWAYPAWLGAWPATLALVALIGLEVWPGAAHTREGIALLAGGYLVVGLVGTLAFGANVWLRNADPFERALAWWGAFAPLQRTSAGWRLSWPGAGLVDRAAAGPSDVAFVVALLYGVNFDAFLGTRLGAGTFERLAGLGAELAFALTLLAGLGLFVGAFALCARAIAKVAATVERPRALAARFAPSLVPIAVGYHVAHNAPYLVGLATDLPAAGAGAGALVALQMLAIVGGHVAAVVVAHEQAFTGFPSRVQAIKSELPLTGVMVLYTIVGLWLVSQGHGALPPGVVR